MTSMTTSSSAARTEIIALQIVVAALLIIRAYTQFNSGLVADEAYYWMWGQHPGWSYLDHPPLHAWLLGIVSVLGWHPFIVRLLTWVSLAVVMAVFWSWAKRLAPENAAIWFWRATAIYLASPLFFVLTGAAYHDHLLIALSLAAMHFFAVYVDKIESGGGSPNRHLFAAATLLGLAVLTKYNAIFIGIGFGVTFLVRDKLRPLILTPVPWLAAALAIGIQAPVLWWNLTEGGGSYKFHLHDRWRIEPGFRPVYLLRFLGQTILTWSPFLLWPLILLVFKRPAFGFTSALRSVALCAFAVSTLVFSSMALIIDAFFYWNIVALAAVTPLLVVFTNRWLRWLHLIYGFVAAIVVMVHLTIIPTSFILGTKEFGTAINYDWHVVAEHMRVEAAEHPDAILGATRYSTTSQLGIALGTTDVVKLSPEFSQWDFWQEGRDFTGRSALVLTDEPDNHERIKFLRDHFETLTVVDSFSIERLGRAIYPWRIMLGEGWKN